MTSVLDQHQAEDFAFYNGDSCEVIRGIPDASVGLTVSSPPFPAMYAYSASPRDIGNTSGTGEMLDHFRYLVAELRRITMPGRSCCIHVSNTALFKHRDGAVGRMDFRGDVIRLFQSEGWLYASEILIDKCPQVRAQRQKEHGLMFKSLATDASVMAPVMADYLIVFRKPGDNFEPIRAGRSAKYNNLRGWITEDEWIEWARAVWYGARKGLPGGIRETDVLNVAAARSEQDERHLCPLQLGVIERCVKLWSNPGDVVFDPFGGVGSTPYKAILLHRYGVGIELKPEYYRQAIRNCTAAAAKARESQADLFAFAEDAPCP